MSATVETTSNLGRKITVSLPMQPITEEINKRINQLARTAKLSGFRPGKVPMNIVRQQYGDQVLNEVLTKTVEKSFGEAVEENKLRVAGFPNIEHKPFTETGDKFEFVASFEIFPEVKVGDIKKSKIEKPVLEVGEAEVKKTLDVLLKQRATYEPVKRAAKKGDRVNISLTATMEGQPVESTGEQGLDLVISEGGRYPEFDENIIGQKAGAEKTFDITYPADHNPAQLAGKTVSYQVKVNSVSQIKLPGLDAEFAKSLGVDDGDLEVMKAEIKASLEQEVSKRIKARLKEQVFQVLVESTEIELPQALINIEIERLMQMTAQNLQQRGADLSQVRLEPAMFQDQAKNGVKLRLILSELVRANDLVATADQIREMVNQFGQSFEQPEDVVRWYYADPKRLDEPAALATEENVVNWVLAAVKVSEKKVKFDELMGNA